MMGRTHITVGIASALLVGQPSDFAGCLTAIIGGSVGGVICDIEVRSNPRCRDALHARLIVLAIVTVALLVEAGIGGPLSRAIFYGNHIVLGVGAAVAALTAVYSRFWSTHRGFSHSLLALALFSGGLMAILPSLALAFGLGFASHVLLDLMNKKPIQLLYPSRRQALSASLLRKWSNQHSSHVGGRGGSCLSGLAIPLQGPLDRCPNAERDPRRGARSQRGYSRRGAAPRIHVDPAPGSNSSTRPYLR